MTTRNKYLLGKFGITEEQYNGLLEKQGGGCAICRRNAGQFKTKLAVDHNHLSGEIRGLLCFYCNRYRVGRNRDADIVQSVANYLRQGTGWIVPPKRKRKKRRKK